MCPLCEKRRAKRFCPAQGAAICPLCCGRFREVTLDCPLDCPHLRASREHGARDSAEPPASPPLAPELEISAAWLAGHEDLLQHLAGAVGAYWAREPRLADPDLLDVLRHLAATLAAERAGVVFESLPSGALREGLFRQIQQAFAAYRPRPRGLGPAPPPRAQDWEMAVVYLGRAVRLRGNGRPRSRLCLEWLAPEAAAAAARRGGAGLIVVP
ncbi:MAG: hypothetical protein ACRD2F_09765 [Terriglobales bacterium]